MLFYFFYGGTDLLVMVTIIVCYRSTTTNIEGIREDLKRKFYKPDSADIHIGDENI
jgi:hypothetical protein